MANVLIAPIPSLRELKANDVDEIQNKGRIAKIVLVAIGNPVGIIVAGLRQPQAVVLVNDPAFPGLAQRFHDLMQTAESYPEASILSTELNGILDLEEEESAAFEKFFDNTWSSEASFTRLKACTISVCQSFEEATQFHPHDPREYYFQNESDMLRAASPPLPLDLAQSAFLFGFGEES